MSSITDYATLAMAIATTVLAWFTRKSIKSTQEHNRNVDEYNKQTLEVMRASHRPKLSLDLRKEWKKIPETTPKVTSYYYWIIIRNDGMGPATNVKLSYKFGHEPSLMPGEGWKESEEDFELHYRSDWDIGNIAANGKWEGHFWPLEEDSSYLNSIYAIRLMATCESDLEEKNYVFPKKIYIDDIKDKDL